MAAHQEPEYETVDIEEPAYETVDVEETGHEEYELNTRHLHPGSNTATAAALSKQMPSSTIAVDLSGVKTYCPCFNASNT